MKKSMAQKIICLIVVSAFLINNIAYGLSPAPGSTQSAIRAEMYSSAQELLTQKFGPGSIDFDSYPSQHIDSGLLNNLGLRAYIEAVYGYQTKFAWDGYYDYTEARGRGPISDGSDLVEAFRYFKTNLGVSDRRTANTAWNLFYHIARSQSSSLTTAEPLYATGVAETRASTSGTAEGMIEEAKIADVFTVTGEDGLRNPELTYHDDRADEAEAQATRRALAIHPDTSGWKTAEEWEDHRQREKREGWKDAPDVDIAWMVILDSPALQTEPFELDSFLREFTRYIEETNIEGLPRTKDALDDLGKEIFFGAANSLCSRGLVGIGFMAQNTGNFCFAYTNESIPNARYMVTNAGSKKIEQEKGLFDKGEPYRLTVERLPAGLLHRLQVKEVAPASRASQVSDKIASRASTSGDAAPVGLSPEEVKAKLDDLLWNVSGEIQVKLEGFSGMSSEIKGSVGNVRQQLEALLESLPLFGVLLELGVAEKGLIRLKLAFLPIVRDYRSLVYLKYIEILSAYLSAHSWTNKTTFELTLPDSFKDAVRKHNISIELTEIQIRRLVSPALRDSHEIFTCLKGAIEEKDSGKDARYNTAEAVTVDDVMAMLSKPGYLYRFESPEKGVRRFIADVLEFTGLSAATRASTSGEENTPAVMQPAAAVRYWVERLTIKDLNIIKNAVRKLDEMGPAAAPAVDALKKALSDTYSPVCTAASRAIANIEQAKEYATVAANGKSGDGPQSATGVTETRTSTSGTAEDMIEEANGWFAKHKLFNFYSYDDNVGYTVYETLHLQLGDKTHVIERKQVGDKNDKWTRRFEVSICIGKDKAVSAVALIEEIDKALKTLKGTWDIPIDEADYHGNRSHNSRTWNVSVRQALRRHLDPVYNGKIALVEKYVKKINRALAEDENTLHERVTVSTAEERYSYTERLYLQFRVKREGEWTELSVERVVDGKFYVDIDPEKAADLPDYLFNEFVKVRNAWNFPGWENEGFWSSSEFEEKLKKMISSARPKRPDTVGKAGDGPQSATGVTDARSSSSGEVPATETVAEGHELIRLISDYIVNVGLDKGPGTEKLSAAVLEDIYKAVGLLHNETAIELFVPQQIRLTNDMQRAIKAIGKRQGRTPVILRQYSDLDRLAELLKSEPQGKRMVITDIADEAAQQAMARLVEADPEPFRAARVLNIAPPANYSDMPDTEKTIYQAKMVTIAILARLFEKDNTLMVGALLREMLRDCLDEKDISEYLNKLGESDNELPREALAARILFFIGKTVKLAERIGEEIRLMKAFWTAA